MIKTYQITPPSIPSGGEYFFTTDSGMRYEVRFGRKQNNLLAATIVFGVINEEFEGEEYTATNKGEVYRVMNTIIQIVDMYREQHPNVNSYEFTGEPTSEEEENQAQQTTRIKLYNRYAQRMFSDDWKIDFNGNKITVYK